MRDFCTTDAKQSIESNKMFNFGNLKPEVFYIGFKGADVKWGRFELIWRSRALESFGKLKSRIDWFPRLVRSDGNCARYIASEVEIQWGAGNQLLMSYPSLFKRKAGGKAFEIKI